MQHVQRVDAVASKSCHSNDINDTVHIVCCQKRVLGLPKINTGASIHFISSQNTIHSILGKLISSEA